ncbi:hypothetical protein TWF694_010188 [Orbilia ellipsospora]|uniref:F-box domain-containing protein n=1 Tax=Orbilia ellipsospora TaxID=2528407 RepID=A0AAV9X963_9PEZI
MSNPPQHALLLPEILSVVLEWVYLKESLSEEEIERLPESYTSLWSPNLADLAHCACVNKLWFKEAIRILWRNPTKYNTRLNKLSNFFYEIEPERQQFYLDHIEEFVIQDVSEQDEASRKPLHHLEYPNLKTITMRAAGWWGFRFAKFGKNSARKLRFDPRFDVYPDTYGVDQEKMKKTLDYIVETFPNLESLEILDRCLAYPGDLENFARRMPKLKTFNHELVWVGHGDPPNRY